MGHSRRPPHAANHSTDCNISTTTDAAGLLFTGDLLESERAFLAVMQRLGFVRFEFVQIHNGELVLDPWPTTVRGIRFGSDSATEPECSNDDFALKRQVAEFFEYVRANNAGEIRCLEVRHGLPFSMEIEHGAIGIGGACG